MLFGAFQFITTYEQTAQRVEQLSEEVGQSVSVEHLDNRLMDISNKLDEATRDMPQQLERLTRVEEQVQSDDATVDLDRLKGDLDIIKERVVFVESQLQNAQGSQDALRQIDARVDQLDDFVVRWDEQSSMIMIEHEQLGDIVEDIYARLDELSGNRTRVQLPAGSQRGYGYD